MSRGLSLITAAKEEHSVHLGGYQASLRRYFSRRVKAQWDVDNLVQETLTRFIVVNRTETISQPFGYLYRIANNLLVDHARRGAVTSPVMTVLEDDDQAGIRAEQEDALHLADLRAALEEALDELPPKCREAFVLRRFHDMDTPAIAARLAVSHRMVQKYLIRAMGHVHQRLQRRGDNV